jgi:ABC-type phosphate/phosphonate transport system substrate-binding protein
MLHSYFIKHLIIFNCFLLLIGSTSIGQTRKESENRNYRFIYSTNLFHNTKTEDAIALTKIFSDKIKKNKKIKEDVEIVLCENEKELADSIIAPFDLLLMTATEHIKVTKSRKIKPVLINETQGSFGYVYYLITNKESGIKNLKDLRNGTIRILGRKEGQTPSIWLDKLLRDNKLPVKEKFFKEISYDNKPTNVVLPVFFNKISAAIVSKPTFELLSVLNPQIKKQANFLMESKTLIFGTLSFDPRNKDKEREKFVYETLTAMHNDVDGKQFLDLFNVDKIIPYKEEHWEEFLKLYE